MELNWRAPRDRNSFKRNPPPHLTRQKLPHLPAESSQPFRGGATGLMGIRAKSRTSDENVIGARGYNATSVPKVQ
jgi:hypothetical protein